MKQINRIYGGAEAETRKSQVSFQIISLMRGLPSIRLKESENEPGISLSRPQPHH